MTTHRIVVFALFLLGACGGSGRPSSGTGSMQTMTSSGPCVPQCSGKQCGDDGCGGSCGTCTAGGCTNGACEAQPSCSGDTCTCPGSLTVCPHVCADLDNDVSNCGSCGYACPAGPSGSHAVCSAGACSTVCDDATKTVCQGENDEGQSVSTCADLSSDIANCGACGNGCYAPDGVTSSCNAGTCGEGCSTGQSLCPGEYGSQTCVDLSSDPNNCGACGNVCPANGGTATCKSGSCATSCATGQTMCNGVCTDLTSDKNNCGACGTVCQDQTYGTGYCSSGSCTTSCELGYPSCGGECCGGSYGHCCSSDSGDYCLQPGYDCYD